MNVCISRVLANQRLTIVKNFKYLKLNGKLYICSQIRSHISLFLIYIFAVRIRVFKKCPLPNHRTY